MKNMYNIRTLLAGLILMTVVIAACVKGDFDEPPLYIPEADLDANQTIAGLKDWYNANKPSGANILLIEEDIIIVGTVVANDESGNLYKKIVIQDETSGIEINLDKTNLYNQYKLGQRIYIKCKDMSIGEYAQLIQLGYPFEGSIGRLPEVFIPDHLFPDSLPGAVPEPRVITVNQINNYLYSTLVQFELAHFADGDVGNMWAPEPASATNRTMFDKNNQTIIVRTSKYADFATELVPAGVGTVTGILGRFNTTIQLALRDSTDLKNFGGDPPPPPELPEVNTTIAALKAGYISLTMIQDDLVIGGIVTANDESGNLYKKMVIQDETGGIEINLDKLNLHNDYKVGQALVISLNGMYIGDYNNLIQLGYIFNGSIGRLPESMIPQHVLKDGTPGPAPVPQLSTIGSLNYNMVSTLLTFEGVCFPEFGQQWAPDPANATNRTMIGPNGTMIVRTSRFADFASQPIPKGFGKVTGVLTIFGSTYQLALRDINDVGVFDGSDGCGSGGGGVGTGTGTQSDPYNVEAGIFYQGQSLTAWVKGYIVGTVKDGVNTVTSSNDLQLTPPFTRNTNVLIADSPSESDHTKIIAVNLPAGTPLRTDVNLVDNPDNLGKLLNVRGVLRSYFGIAGSRDSDGSSASFELEDGGGGGGTPTSIFLETFSTNLGTFSEFSVAGDQKWGWATFDGGCAVMSGFVQGSSYANEDWLISPAISLAGKTGVTMSFREAINFITSYNDLKIFISTDYTGSGNPNTNGSWTEITGFNRAPGNSWTFIDSGEVSLSAYEDETIHIAFKFLSTTTASSTWEISRVEVKGE